MEAIWTKCQAWIFCINSCIWTIFYCSKKLLFPCVLSKFPLINLRISNWQLYFQFSWLENIINMIKVLMKLKITNIIWIEHITLQFDTYLNTIYTYLSHIANNIVITFNSLIFHSGHIHWLLLVITLRYSFVSFWL